MEGLYKVVRTVGRTHLGGGGSPKIVMVGSQSDCEDERTRLDAATHTTGDTLDATLGRATTYTVEPADPGDKVSWSQ
jgi:hypothetical protein